MNEIERLIKEGVVELEVYKTSPSHPKIYGLDSKNPLYFHRIFVSEKNRQQGIGSDVLMYIENLAIENNHDLIFGHISQKATPNREYVRLFLEKFGYICILDNYDFYKKINKHEKDNIHTSDSNFRNTTESTNCNC